MNKEFHTEKAFESENCFIYHGKWTKFFLKKIEFTMASTAGDSHFGLLKVHCRLCGQKRIDNHQNRGVLVKNHPQLCRFLRFLHEIEAERESEEIYPTRACDACISRLRNVSICQENSTKKLMDNVFELATKLHTEGRDDEMRKLAREFPAADFWAHSSNMCAICDDSHKDAFPVPDFNSHLLIEVNKTRQLTLTL